MYFFQNGRDGHPMMLMVEPTARVVVVRSCPCDDDHDCADLQCDAILDAREMTAALRAAGRSTWDERRMSREGAEQRAARWLAREYRLEDLAADV